MDYIVPVIVTVAVLIACYIIFRTWTTDYVIVDTIKDGKQNDIYANRLPPSINRPAGIEFSYTGWLRIDDFAYRVGVQKVIFVKGSADLSTACPALVIDANTNTLLVKIDTYGAQETIPIVSVPSKKWLHIAISIGQDFVDVYIDGILYAHHILTQLPKQNSGAVVTSPDGGFAGRIVRLEYHPQTLTAGDVSSRAREQPPTGEENQSFPKYFDMSWFTLQD
jgi:hypothetical protein